MRYLVGVFSLEWITYELEMMMSKISIGQIGELIRKDGRGELGSMSSEDLQWLLEKGNWAKVAALRSGRPVSYDQSIGLEALIERAVGKDNVESINFDIIPIERFILKGTDVRKVTCWVEPYLEEETSEQAALRLTTAGHILGNTADLAGFLHDHPNEVKKWDWVLAISENSRQTSSDGIVYTPCALAGDSLREFSLYDFNEEFIPSYGILVVSDE